MPRGGKRQGTPGKAYSNRTDLMSSMKPPAPGQVNTAASGGMTATPAQPPAPEQQAAAPMPSPDDTPMLTGETMYPDEPITTGLHSGPGAGPPNLFAADTQKMQRYLPLLQPFLDRPEVPDSVRMLYRYIRSS
jgi:hypothetical protein